MPRCPSTWLRYILLLLALAVYSSLATPIISSPVVAEEHESKTTTEPTLAAVQSSNVASLAPSKSQSSGLNAYVIPEIKEPDGVSNHTNPAFNTTFIFVEPDGKPAASPASRSSCFFALLGLAFLCMSMSSGGIVYKFRENARYHRLSPLFCLGDALLSWYYLLWHQRKLKGLGLTEAAKEVINYRTRSKDPSAYYTALKKKPGAQPASKPDTALTQALDTLSKDTTFRLFVAIPTLLQFVKICAFKGIPWITAFASLYIVYYLTMELLAFLASGRWEGWIRLLGLKQEDADQPNTATDSGDGIELQDIAPGDTDADTDHQPPESIDISITRTTTSNNTGGLRHRRGADPQAPQLQPAVQELPEPPETDDVLEQNGLFVHIFMIVLIISIHMIRSTIFNVFYDTDWTWVVIWLSLLSAENIAVQESIYILASNQTETYWQKLVNNLFDSGKGGTRIPGISWVLLFLILVPLTSGIGFGQLLCFAGQKSGGNLPKFEQWLIDVGSKCIKYFTVLTYVWAAVIALDIFVIWFLFIILSFGLLVLAMSIPVSPSYVFFGLYFAFEWMESLEGSNVVSAFVKRYCWGHKAYFSSNLLFGVVYFAFLYDERGTYKPAWTEYLG
ncbi:hypothetical protein DFH27DRAFT_525393 [Peziza echinospora]|nr:hypothetical protein DFH27DRAFT_525393 [Peziza echinospora]